MERSRRKQYRGFVLIYVLTILLFLVATVTGAAYALRLNSSAIYQEREQLAAEFRLRGALQYALAQFALARADTAPNSSVASSATPSAAPSAGAPANSAATPAAERPERPRRGWRLEASRHPVQIDGADVAATIDDPGGIADANALDERMWTDYFVGLGAAQPEAARRWAAALLESKASVGKANGRTGFASIDDLMALDVLPAAVRYGGWAGADRARSGETETETETIGPGLPDLFLIGSGEQVLDVNRAALPLVAAITGAGADALAAYGAARRRGKITVEDAVRMLGSRARTVLRDGRTDPIFRLVLTTTAGAGRMELAAFLRLQNNELRVLATRLQPLAAVEPDR